MEAQSYVVVDCVQQGGVLSKLGVYMVIPWVYGFEPKRKAKREDGYQNHLIPILHSCLTLHPFQYSTHRCFAPPHRRQRTDLS